MNDKVTITTNSQIWNRDAAVARLGGNESLLNRIVEMFLAQIKEKQHALHEGVKALDAESIRFHSHSMKGASGDVGADALREKASSIEIQAKQANLENIEEELVALDALIADTVNAMQKL